MPASQISAVHTASASWSNASAVYNNKVGRTTAKATEPLIHLANAKFSISGVSRRVIDLGTGTGSFALELARRYPDVPIVATDIAEEGTFTHAFNFFAIQMGLDPALAVQGMYQLLQPGSGAVAAIAIWDFVRECAPHGIWDETARRVDSSYVPPPRSLTNHWQCLEDMEDEMHKVGFKDVKAEVFETEFDFQPHIVDGFVELFFDSNNPFPLERVKSFPSPDLGLLRSTMKKVLEEREQANLGYKLSLALAVGTLP